MTCMIGKTLATAQAERSGAAAMVCAATNRLVFYDREARSIGSTLIDEHGMVSRHAVEWILEQTGKESPR